MAFARIFIVIFVISNLKYIDIQGMKKIGGKIFSELYLLWEYYVIFYLVQSFLLHLFTYLHLF